MKNRDVDRAQISDPILRNQIMVAYEKFQNHNATIVTNVGRVMGYAGWATLPESNITEIDVYLRAIAINPKHAPAFNCLATCIRLPGAAVLLPDGGRATAQQLLLKAVDLDPGYVAPYHNLAASLPPLGSVTLMNGSTLTKKELLQISNKYLPRIQSLGAAAEAAREPNAKHVRTALSL